MNRLPRLLTAAAMALAVALPAVAVADDATGADDRAMACSGKDRVRTCTVALPDGVKVRNRTVQVLLPAGYDASTEDYPVVFMLHGVGDNETSWLSSGRLGALTAACSAIFVSPDGGSGAQAGWYSDWVDGTYQWETFHTQVLPKAVDATFRTKGKKARAVAGLSMGGFGALSYAARHPGMYKAAAAYSAFADTLFGAPASGAVYQHTGQSTVASTGAPSSRVWGDQTAQRQVWAAHNPYDLAKALKGTAVYLSSGDGTPGHPKGDNPAKAANYVLEAYIGHLNDRLADRLRAEGVAFTDARYAGGYHDWPFWQMSFTDSLRTLMPALGAASKGCGA